ncbi:hypothetical protein CWS02_10690 [Enterobacter sp. EA-1]|nr:hypothetical protein CWS02_10690 [Enterobacter sp. EA-1]
MISGSWLDNLLNHGLRPEVGITGAKLLYPTGKVQHAGVVLGLRGRSCIYRQRSGTFRLYEPLTGRPKL